MKSDSPTHLYWMAILAGFFGSVIANLVNKATDESTYVTTVFITGLVIMFIALFFKKFDSWMAKTGKKLSGYFN